MKNSRENMSFPMDIPVVAESESFLYPFMIAPLFFKNKQNIKTLESAYKNSHDDSLILVVPLKKPIENTFGFEDFYDIGVIGSILRLTKVNDGRARIVFQGLKKGKIIKQVTTNPIVANTDIISAKSEDASKIGPLMSILLENIHMLNSIVSFFSQDFLTFLKEAKDANAAIDKIASAIKMESKDSYKLFIETDLEKRIVFLIGIVKNIIEASRLHKQIKSQVDSKINKANREYVLKEQLKQIEKELGVGVRKNNEVLDYKNKLQAKKEFMSTGAYKEINKQLDKFSKTNQNSADAGMLQSYLDWTLGIPFEKVGKRKLSIKDVGGQLDKDHYGLKKPKNRIKEYFAVRELLQRRKIKLKKSQGEILCFIGPPGVGKTSLANSIAKALKRKLARIALGGLEDVNELRGHRRTYIGAMPGLIVQGLINTKQMNPVMVLDEIDKIGRSYKGDPTSALLEILDPQQNSAFRDYYLNFEIDLSRIIFITTANNVGQIPAPLRDRMEFIGLNSYTPQEKFHIAKDYLFPQELKKHGIEKEEVLICDKAFKKIISEYTQEAGVRDLTRKIADILRKCTESILKSETKKESIKQIVVSENSLKSYLDMPIFDTYIIKKINKTGIVNGLAWTIGGGRILKVEAVVIHNGTGILELTGSLGDVMKESVKISYSVVKVLIDSGIISMDEKLLSSIPKKDVKDIYKKFDIHIHSPEGAIPKDGPSAGVTMATAIASILSNKKVRCDVAMTGELTLFGDVLQIGGLKEKLIAAYTSGVKTALIPRKNLERDLKDIPTEVRKKLKIIPVDNIKEVLKEALI